MAIASAATPQPTGSFGKYWWLALAAGALTIFVGFLALAYPGPTLLVVGVMFGIYLIFWSVMTILRGIAGDPGASTVWRVALVLLGVLTLLAGLVLLVRPGQSVLTAAWAMGFWWVLTGVIRLVGGIAEPAGRVINIILGLIGIVAGGIILAQPAIGLITLVWVVSIGLIVQGAMEMAAGLQIRKLHKEGLA
jgi:uncharacterized membrane protein HdeD (DUF308 family)